MTTFPKKILIDLSISDFRNQGHESNMDNDDESRPMATRSRGNRPVAETLAQTHYCLQMCMCEKMRYL